MSLEEMIVTPEGAQDELSWGFDLSDNEKDAVTAFDENLKKQRSQTDQTDEAVLRYPNQNIQHIRETEHNLTPLTVLQPPPAALAINTTPVESYQQAQSSNAEFYQQTPAFLQVDNSPVEGLTQIAYVEAYFAPTIQSDVTPNLSYVDSGPIYPYQVQEPKVVKPYEHNALPNAESLLKVTNLKHAQNTAQICKSVKDLKLESPKVVTEKSRKRGREAAPSLEELKEEIEKMENDPNADEDELKKKRNNLACRTHRAKNKRTKEAMEEFKSTLESELEYVKTELKECKQQLQKTNDFLQLLKRDPEMPPKLAKKIEKRLR
ncbi:uncharacterized protein LOC142351507 [Convolutriloba macropyga]|uniref:uncharacterized protein LOC142351507 n=1 Tax=Convolutriloba macropyga TaxID=536237 RepID=UPI003F51F384